MLSRVSSVRSRLCCTGSAFSECAACVNNLKEFWCQFTCAPNQADFLHPIALVNVTDPSTKVNTTALQMTLDITPDLACGVFDSCKGTTKCRSVQTMKTCNGFLDYQGQYEAIGRGNYIQFNYTAADTAMNFPPQDCSNFTNSDGTHSSCSCSSLSSASSPMRWYTRQHAIYVCICVHMYIYICICIYIHTYTHIYTYIDR